MQDDGNFVVSGWRGREKKSKEKRDGKHKRQTMRKNKASPPASKKKITFFLFSTCSNLTPRQNKPTSVHTPPSLSGLLPRPRGQRDRHLRHGHRRRPQRHLLRRLQARRQAGDAARPRPGPAVGLWRDNLEDEHGGEGDGGGDGVRGAGRRGGASR